ncbi:HK97 gp10 family phage protein [Pseudoclavibacter sp. RFBB5]|uniref:HK97 gp10 family phage protein n=1 Tax=Pseudoclavibacter sp. RFBB5 TaxID=2080574 RepID=UPI000CE86A7A|nr:HK97 gp10 family phage protein [Pseudoclavibacter sp. RFBB5]PPG29647.1 hypothetical protein C5B97_11790 [Pseudoclavibacter sp. RFBB5]
MALVRDFEFDESFFQVVAHSPEVTALTRDAADRVADNVRAVAPVDTGDYVESIHVVKTSRDDRSEFAVVSDDPAAIVIESQDAPMARGLIRSARG